MAIPYSDNATKLAPSASGVATPSVIRSIGLSDLHDALRLGWEDFKAVPSHAVILCVIYPVLGIVLFRMVLGYSVLPLLFPLAAGFALLGPFAALGLYELSRRRERGEEPSAWDALGVLRAPSFGAMLGLGTMLLALFLTWVAAANAVYVSIFGHTPAASIPDFATRVLTDAGRLDADHRRLRRRLPVRPRGPVRQCCVLSVDARSARECDRRNPDVAAGCDQESIRHGRLGADCCGPAGDRFAAVLRRSRGRSAGARSCHLASLSEGGRARSKSSTTTTPPAERPPLCGRFPGQSLPVEP